jgi:energy-coupling factor transporter transmembrane protein EcfT
MENVGYTEWVPTGALVKGLFVMVSSIIVFVTFAVFLFSKELLVEDIFGVAFAWVILAILLFIFWNYRGLRIQIKNDTLSLDYGLFNKKSFLLKEITSCKKTKAFGRYFGVGVRYGLDGSMAYTTSFANVVEVVPKVGRTFVFSSKNPDKVCEIITKGMLS